MPVENEFHFQDDADWKSLEENMFNDPSFDRRPYEIETDKLEQRVGTLRSLLITVLEEPTRFGKGAAMTEFGAVLKLAPLFGLTTHETYNLVDDQNWRKFCLSPILSPTFTTNDNRSRH